MHMSTERVTTVNCMRWGVNGGWSGITVIWQNEDTMEEFWNGCSHTFIYCCHICLLPFLTLAQVFSLHDPVQPREVQGQLLNGTKVKKVEREFEYVWSCQKDKLCSVKRGAGSTAKRKDEGDIFLILSVCRLPWCFPPALCIMAPEACNVLPLEMLNLNMGDVWDSGDPMEQKLWMLTQSCQSLPWIM